VIRCNGHLRCQANAARFAEFALALVGSLTGFALMICRRRESESIALAISTVAVTALLILAL
jgi:hypothetical protein